MHPSTLSLLETQSQTSRWNLAASILYLKPLPPHPNTTNSELGVQSVAPSTSTVLAELTNFRPALSHPPYLNIPLITEKQNYNFVCVCVSRSFALVAQAGVQWRNLGSP